MRTGTQLFAFLMLFVSLCLTEPAHSQTEPALDGYILDTVFRPSPTDSTVMDTVIIARKKVVVKKEIVVEKEVYVDPIFHHPRLGIFAGPVFSRNEAFSHNASPYLQTTDAPGYEFGICYQTALWKTIAFSVSASYLQQKQTARTYQFSQYNETVYDTVKTLIETYYMQVNGETKQIDIYDNIPTQESVLHTDSAQISNSIRHQSFLFQTGLGACFEHKRISFYPQITAGVRYQIAAKVSGADSIFIQDAPQNHTAFAYGATVTVSVPVYKRIELFASPSVLFFSRKLLSTDQGISNTYNIRFGIYYRFR